MEKRKLSKKLLSYILCLVMVIALVPMNALTVRAEGVEQLCQHCGGTGKACSFHKNVVHEGESYENQPECDYPCVIILRDDEDYCDNHEDSELGQCEYCKGKWTHDHHFVYVHMVDGEGTNFHLFKCDYPGCIVYGNAPGHGQNCNTDGPDGACSYCGFKAEAPAHTHTKGMHHAPVAATCTNPGVVEYWDCSCGEKLDADGNVLSSTVGDAALGHSWGTWSNGTHSCTRTGCSETETCTHGGATTGVCSTCGKELGIGSTPTSTPTPTPSTPEKASEEKSDTAAKSEPAKTYEETVKAEEALPVAEFVSAEAVNTIPVEAKAVAPTTSATYNLSKVTTTQGFVAAVGKISASSPVAKSVTVYSEKPVTFNTSAVNAVAGMDKDFVYMFKYKGRLYQITIPKGKKVNLNGQVFAGPLYIGAQLGTTKVIK